MSVCLHPAVREYSRMLSFLSFTPSPFPPTHYNNDLNKRA
nr:MAG TPA: hypothetical protein [Caudoviricetes sp.]